MQVPDRFRRTSRIWSDARTVGRPLNGLQQRIVRRVDSTISSRELAETFGVQTAAVWQARRAG